MARRQRVDSVAGAVAVARGASRPIEPPAHVPLDPDQMRFFASVIDEFPRSEWTCHQLELAAMLARNMAMVEQYQRTLAADGPTVISAKGHTTLNPVVSAITQMQNGILSARRSLSLHARARAGEAKDVAKRRSAVREIEDELSQDGDGFLN